jgi:hypothetical protein
VWLGGGNASPAALLEGAKQAPPDALESPRLEWKESAPLGDKESKPFEYTKAAALGGCLEAVQQSPQRGHCESALGGSSVMQNGGSEERGDTVRKRSNGRGSGAEELVERGGQDVQSEHGHGFLVSGWVGQDQVGGSQDNCDFIEEDFSEGVAAEHCGGEKRENMLGEGKERHPQNAEDCRALKRPWRGLGMGERVGEGGKSSDTGLAAKKVRRGMMSAERAAGGGVWWREEPVQTLREKNESVSAVIGGLTGNDSGGGLETGGETKGGQEERKVRAGEGLGGGREVLHEQGGDYPGGVTSGTEVLNINQNGHGHSSMVGAIEADEGGPKVEDATGDFASERDICSVPPKPASALPLSSIVYKSGPDGPGVNKPGLNSPSVCKHGVNKPGPNGYGSPSGARSHSTKEDPNFINNYYKNSRLHFIGTWRTRYQAMGGADHWREGGGRPELPKEGHPLTEKERLIVHIDMVWRFGSEIDVFKL